MKIKLGTLKHIISEAHELRSISWEQLQAQFPDAGYRQEDACAESGEDPATFIYFIKMGN